MARESGIGKLLDLARSDRRHLATLDQLRRHIVVMFTDIQGSTSYFEKHGDAAGMFMVHQCNSMLHAIVEEHGGRVIKTIGDGMLAIFEQCGKSLEAGIRMQHAVHAIADTQADGDRLAIRIGIHDGTGIVRTRDVFGDVVNVASRIESVAQARQIVISESLYEKVAELGFSIQKLGRFALKGKTADRILYEVVWGRVPAIACGTLKGGAGPRCFRLQVLDELKAIKSEHSLTKGITVGRLQGDVTFPEDVAMAPASLRIFIEEDQVFVSDLTNGTQTIFIRIAVGHTLQNDDIVLIGRQVLKYREVTAAMSVAAELGMDLSELSQTLEEPVAELRNLNPSDSSRFPLTAEEVYFGRMKGNYTFPDDKLMSRSHARVLQRAEDFIIEDLGSRNGTFVKLRGTTPLGANGMILVGNQLLRIVIG